MHENYVTELITTTQALEACDEKKYADSLWEVVTRVNIETINKVRKDDFMCKALAEIMKPELDEAFDNGVNQGKSAGKILVFKNMIKAGMSKELAQEYAELSDQLVEQVLANM